MDVNKIRNSLRNEDSEDLAKRRKVIFLSAIGLADFSLISLYQTGVIKKLPDIPLPVFDSNKVNVSKDAYQFGAPDGPVSSLTYSATMVLASAGGGDSAGRKPVLDLALGAAVAANSLGAVFYLGNMVFKQKKICIYCLTGAAINIVSAVIIAPLVLKSLRKIFK